MARLQIYEQQTASGSVRASGQEFGAGVAQAAGQLGDVVADIGLQMQRRQDVVERVQLTGEFDKWAQDSLTTLNDTGDIGTKATVDQYNNGLREKAAEIVKRHGGSMNSRAELQVQIENQAAQYAKSATAAQVKAQQTIIGNTVEQKVNELSISATFAPDKMFDTFTELDRTIDMLGDAMSPQLAAQYKEAGRSKIAQNSISRMLTNGNYTAAKAIMENPEVGKYLDPDSSRRFGIEIAVDEGKTALETQRVDREVQNWTTRLKRDLTPEEVIKIKSLPQKKSEMTPSDKIVEYELVTGKPASQAVIDEMFDVGASGGGSMFGNSLQGRALDFVTNNAVAYANDMLSPTDRRQFEASVSAAYKPVERINPATGLVEKFSPTLPAFVQDAVDQGSRFRGSGSLTSTASQGAAMPGQRIQYTDPTGRVIGQTTVGADGNWTIQDNNPPQGQGGMTTSTQGSTPQSRTIWQRRKNIVGPVASVRSAVQSIPGIGPSAAGVVFDEAETRRADEDRAYVENTSRDLVRILQNNPRFAEGERKAIEKEISIGPEFFKSVESYEAKLMGVNQSLQDRMVDAQRTLQSDVSIEERKRAMDSVNAIENFRQKLGLPVPVKTEEDVKILAPGTVFITPQGKEFTKR